jgi:TctA family transporter
MSSQTFKAQMAVGSWALTPLFTGLSDITTIIEKSRNKENLKDGGHKNGSESEADDELDVEMLTSEP